MEAISVVDDEVANSMATLRRTGEVGAADQLVPLRRGVPEQRGAGALRPVSLDGQLPGSVLGDRPALLARDLEHR